jgi:hypothetical protein
MSALEQAVRARLEARLRWFDSSYPPRSAARAAIQAEVRLNWTIQSARGQRTPDAEYPISCPACGSTASVGGDETGESFEETEGTLETPPGRIVTTYYESSILRCRACHLTLDGLAELRFAEVLDEFSIEHEWEPHFDEEYMNE